MSSLDLRMGVPTDSFCENIFPILFGFLQPDTAMTLNSTANSILDLLPEKDPNSTDVWSFGELCIELAEQIPFHHSSQLKLGQITTLEGMNTTLFHRYQRLGESLRDSFMVDPDYPSRYVNFHAFAANLDERRVFSTSPTWAIWAQRDAHEETRQEDQGSIHDAYILAATQWILWYGQSFFKQILYREDVSTDTLRMWSPGPLYDGKSFISLHRWHFWRDSFNAVASEEKGEKGFGQECKTVAGKAAALMDSLEKNMTF